MANEYFEREMKQLLGDEYPAFEATRSQPLFRSLRINTLKTDYEEISGEFLPEGPTPFDENTYYIENEDRPGLHPWHTAGLFYLQEPSATMAVQALQVEKGDRVLDLCAAPGGKSTQILTALQGTGLLWANEINASRAQVLLSNLERWGCDNYVLTSMSPQNLCPMLEGCFDKVLVDAPCSGAGMFRKFPESMNDYTPEAVQACQTRQINILEEAYRCLKQNGVLVYSTCTFNLLEDEEAVARFIENHPDMEVVPSGITGGREGISGNGHEMMRRCFPMDGGEGHFVCRMVKKGAASECRLSTLKPGRNAIVDEFIKENYLTPFPYYVVKDNVYVSSQPLFDFKGKLLRQGILLGSLTGKRFEPHHHGYVAICNRGNFRQQADLDDSEMEKFMHGESIRREGVRGFTAIAYKNHPVSFGKGDGSQIKNRLPKGLRRP